MVFIYEKRWIFYGYVSLPEGMLKCQRFNHLFSRVFTQHVSFGNSGDILRILQHFSPLVYAMDCLYIPAMIPVCFAIGFAKFLLVAFETSF